MRKAAAKLFEFEFSTTSVTRFLVVSYFIGLGLGIVRGVDVGALAHPFVSAPVADVVVGGLVLILSFMVLFGIWRRGAALLMALIVFWASYLTLVVQSGPDQIGSFWRDLALIGALLLTYGEQSAGIHVDLARFAKGLRQRAIPEASPAPEGTAGAESQPSRTDEVQVRQHPKRVKSELYRQDLEVIRVH